MRNAFGLAKKDYGAYFRSWTGPVVFVFFYLLAGIFFSVLVISYAKISIEAQNNAAQAVQGLGMTRFIFSSFFLNMGSVLLFLVPILSMRAFAEERKHESLELLFTYPLSDFEIVWGKYLGMVWFFELLSLPTLIYAGVVYWLGGELDWRTVLSGYLGFWMLGNAYLALGLFVSSLSESPVLSGLATFGALTLFWVLDWATGVADGFWAHLLSSISPLTHYRDFALGIIDLSHIAYFVFFNLYFLFLTLRAIETRNWKG